MSFQVPDLKFRIILLVLPFKNLYGNQPCSLLPKNGEREKCLMFTFLLKCSPAGFQRKRKFKIEFDYGEPKLFSLNDENG